MENETLHHTLLLVGPMRHWSRWSQAAHERRARWAGICHRALSSLTPSPPRFDLFARSLKRASRSLFPPILGFASAMVGPDDDDDEVLAYFLESEILSGVPDQVRSPLPSSSRSHG